MANVRTISFGPGNADLEVQQAELMRRQQMVDALRQNALTPRGTQSVSGIAVQQSPLETLAQLGQIAASTYSQKKIEQQQGDLAKQRAQRQADALKALAPAGVFDNQAANGEAPTTMDAGPDPETRQRWAKILAAGQYNPELANTLLKEELTRTDEQRNMAAQGIDPRQFGQARLAGEIAKGVTNVAPGTSVFNPSTNRFVAAAPDFGAGIQGGYGANGLPQMERIQGSEVIGQMAGDKARAEAAGRAGFNTITVNTPNGPVMMTEEQAAQMAGGGSAAPRSQEAPVNFTASNGVSINLAGQTPQRIIQAAQASGDPQVMQAVNEWMNSGRAPQGQVGIPLQTEAQKEAEIRAVQNAADIEKDLRIKAQSPEAQAAYKDLGATVKLTNAAEPLLQSATGSTLGSLRDKAYGVVGASTKASQAAAQLKVIGGELVGKVPRFSGPTSDSDRKFYIDMAGRVGDETAPVGDRLAALQTLRQFAAQRMEEQAGSLPAQAAEAVRNPKQQPSIDDLMKKYGGR